MIKVRLLGGAKKALGRPYFELDRKKITVSEMLTYFQDISSDPKLLSEGNLIIAVNGVDSQAISGPQTIIVEGDTVTIVTVVHGGTEGERREDQQERDNNKIYSNNNKDYKTNHDDRCCLVIGKSGCKNNKNWNVIVAGVLGKAEEEDAGQLLDRLRKENPDVMIQVADASAVYGLEHVIGVLDISLESLARDVMIANKPEMEVLLRLSCTDQIAEAMKRARFRNNKGSNGCFIAFSNDVQALKKFGEQLAQEFVIDDSVIAPTKEKEKALSKMLINVISINNNNNKTSAKKSRGNNFSRTGARAKKTKINYNYKFLDLLLESAAILVKS
jgi:molybdopterin converting factor small subunit/tRNA threonylcarbamoyladenosine modification (KEOPS) complex Cgi121 subunit